MIVWCHERHVNGGFFLNSTLVRPATITCSCPVAFSVPAESVGITKALSEGNHFIAVCLGLVDHELGEGIDCLRVDVMYEHNEA